MKELINAFIDYRNNCLKLVEREGGTISYRPAPLSYTCFLKDGEVPAEFHQKLRKVFEVTSIEKEGEYYRVSWRDRDSMRKFCFESPNLGIKTYDGDISPVRRYITDTKRKVGRPRAVYFDIETDSRVPFSRKEEMRILCWSLIDKDTGQEFTGMLDEDTDQSEAVLLKNLFSVLADYDQVIAWNGDRFDFFVLNERLKRLKIWVEFRRWLWLDYLELFRRMNISGAESGEEKVSFALDAICQAVLGYGKVDFDSSKTWEAWQTNRDELMKYNLFDVVLMKELELKTGYIELFYTLCDVCGVFPDSYGINPSVQVEGFLLAIARDQDYRFVTRLERFKDPLDKYKGAFVLHPTRAGMIKDVHVCDFASFYPNVIITWNISPETKRKTKDEFCCETPLTNRFYDTRVTGILPFAVNELLRLRKEYQKLEKELPPNTPEWQEAHRKSTAYKIAANAFYGVIGSPMSRFFDRDVAESISQACAWLNKQVMAEAEKRNMTILAGDTDSNFVYGTTRAGFSEFVFGFCNKELIPKLIESWGCKENRIKLDYDKAFERLFIPIDKDGTPIAKKYCGALSHSKGKDATAETTPEIKGLEYRRGDTVKLARVLQKTIIDMLCRAKVEDAETIAIECSKFKELVLKSELKLEDVSISKKLARELGEYKTKQKLDGTQASQPQHVEVAKTLGERGKDVGEGAKISYVIIDGSCSPKIVIPADDWTGECDRYELWDKWVWPPVHRLIGPAFPDYDWTPFERSRPVKPRGTKKQKINPNQTDLFDWIDKKMKEISQKVV